MAYKVKKPCRVCGKMYVPCADCEMIILSFIGEQWRALMNVAKNTSKKYWKNGINLQR